MIGNIQALRFIAALMVFFHHYREHYVVGGGQSQSLIQFGAVGYSGVDIFFVISGFIMWHSTRKDSGLLPAISFLSRRYCRIYLNY